MGLTRHPVGIDGLLARTVRNNAEWCHLMCSLHGARGTFTDELVTP